MARFLTFDEDLSRTLLDAAGVTIAAVDATGDAPQALVAEVLAPQERQVRVEADIEIPADLHSGMGAWHVNAVDEVHVVATGEGIMEFITMEGPVALVVQGGDVVAIRGAEHRYRPVTTQRWVLRFGGPADGDLGATETGRASGEWPTA